METSALADEGTRGAASPRAAATAVASIARPTASRRMEAKDIAGFIGPRPRPCHPCVTAAAAGGRCPFELRLVFERDAPIDRTGRDQIYCYALASWAFDLVHAQPRPLETRGELRSP